MEIKNRRTSPDLSETIRKAAKGNQDAFCTLAQEFDGMFKRFLSGFQVPEAEKEDLYQEGLIGLYKAVLTYDARLSTFSTYAYLCVKRSMISAAKAYTKKNGNISSIDSEQDLLLLDQKTDPQALYSDKENYIALLKRIDKGLSDYENSVLRLFLTGVSHDMIAQKLGSSRKSVDNAISRIRKKLRCMMDERNRLS